MALRLDGFVDLPAHVAAGGFDHAAIHEPTRRLESVATEPGGHTIALDVRRHRLYVSLPRTHRAAVFADT